MKADAERIVVTTGSSGAFILAFLAMFEPGDRVAVTVPGYPPYRHILTALGCEPVLIETTNETRHALTGEALLAAHRKTPLKGVLVGSPANPTGTMMSREALASLMRAADDAGGHPAQGDRPGRDHQPAPTRRRVKELDQHLKVAAAASGTCVGGVRSFSTLERRSSVVDLKHHSSRSVPSPRRQ